MKEDCWNRVSVLYKKVPLEKDRSSGEEESKNETVNRDDEDYG